jgi:rhamnosyltransferase
MDVSIIIPTKNGGPLFGRVLDSIFAQQTEYTYEVICVDSGSSDGTVSEIAKRGCTLLEIAPEEFGHGKTRAYAAGKGTGEFIVFVTQDAMPASEKWLQNFIDAMKEDPEIAGGFGIHEPYPECNIIDKRDLPRHFRNFGEENTIFQLTEENRRRYEEDVNYRQWMVFFSDNNSCIRRAVFEKHPYKDVDFAEDQVWAREIIELGYKKLYCPYAPVYHSHDYSMDEYAVRYFDEFKGLYNMNGYTIADGFLQLKKRELRSILSDVRYVRSQPLSSAERSRWTRYAIRRNRLKYKYGYLGGKYALLSADKQKKIDERIAQLKKW